MVVNTSFTKKSSACVALSLSLSSSLSLLVVMLAASCFIFRGESSRTGLLVPAGACWCLLAALGPHSTLLPSLSLPFSISPSFPGDVPSWCFLYVLHWELRAPSLLTNRFRGYPVGRRHLTRVLRQSRTMEYPHHCPHLRSFLWGTNIISCFHTSLEADDVLLATAYRPPVSMHSALDWTQVRVHFGALSHNRCSKSLRKKSTLLLFLGHDGKQL